MTLHTPVYAQPVAGDVNFPNGIPFTAQELRRSIQAALSVASPVSQAGVTPLDGQFAVTQRAAGANFSVDVAAGYAFVAGTDVANQSGYGCWNDGVVNVPTPSAPASGTEVHRLVLQVEDRFSNALFTGYTANLNLLADTGSGTPAAPASSITLALISISAGQASVLNANIADQRPMLGSELSAWKTAGTSRSTLVQTIDPDLQVIVAANAVYKVEAELIYQGSVAATGLEFGWVVPTGVSGGYVATFNLGGTGVNTFGFGWTTSHDAGNPDTSTYGVQVAGTLITGAAGGVFGVTWASNAGPNTMTMGGGSGLTLRRHA